MKPTLVLLVLLALGMSLFAAGCGAETSMTKEEEESFGGRQPTAEELSKAESGREQSTDPGK